MEASGACLVSLALTGGRSADLGVSLAWNEGCRSSLLSQQAFSGVKAHQPTMLVKG